MTQTEINIPMMETSDQPSERMERKVRERLAEISKSGNGNFKFRTASGAFNEFIKPKKKRWNLSNGITNTNDPASRC